MTRAALAVPVLALAACGGTTTSESLEDVAEETSESSSRIEMRYEASDSSYSGSISGAFDYAGDRAVVTDFEYSEDESLNEPSQPTEVRVLDGTDYVGYEVDGKTYWVKERGERGGDPFALLFPIQGGDHDPSDVFAMVLGASDKIEDIGLERVRGDEATHYRASVDLRKLAEEVPQAQRSDFLDGLEADATLPVDVWVDTESRLRRVSVRERFANEEASMLMTFELFDFGIEVEVEPPPADQIVTQERLDELTRPSDEELEALCREEAPEGDEFCEQTEAPE